MVTNTPNNNPLAGPQLFEPTLCGAAIPQRALWGLVVYTIFFLAKPQLKIISGYDLYILGRSINNLRHSGFIGQVALGKVCSFFWQKIKHSSQGILLG
jgi:hypothetical protein